MTTAAGDGATGEEPVGAPGPPAPRDGACGSPVPVADGVTALSATLDALLTAEVWRCTDAGVRDAVVALERQAARLDAVRLRLLAAADDRSVGRATGAPSTADWLVGATTTRAEHARRRVDLALALQGPLTATGTALAAGDVTGDQAGVIHTTMTRVHPDVDAATRTDAQAFLLEQATHLDPRRLAHVGRHLSARLDPGTHDDLARTEARQTRQRAVRCTQTDDGTWLLSGVLDPTGGATLTAALAPLAAPAPATDGTPDTRTHPRRLADALVTLADAHLAGHTGTSSSRPRLLVTVPLTTVLDPATPGAAPGHLPGGAPVSGQQTQLLSCDAEVVPVLVSDDGTPLDVGRTTYSFPDRIRTAIRHRDQTCTFTTSRGGGTSGRCTRPAARGHLHHLRPWSQGGTTSERNGTVLCGHHHRLVHAQGWRGELRGTQVVWHPPDQTDPHVPPPPWAPRLGTLVGRWRARARAAPPRPADPGCAA
ncbi:DUF222 domain-containing protein [Pseudokineococcus basanitobsidens]|uniref:DUF222 domain-containing protein n=1 Tax=Pseudokineococcus basanitobsidens TaxID=1926649 RepID=A0ABU8RLZ8_9ACTN